MTDNGNKAARRHLSRRSQESAAVINKLIRPQNANSGYQTGNRASVPDQHELMPFVREQMQKRMDSDNVFDILPDVQFAADIVISSILSSKDLITTTLTYECTSQALPLELKSEMLKVVQDYFTKTKPMKNFLYEMLFSAMYKSGSYAVGIIPESSVDAIINEGGKVSLEHAGENPLTKLNAALAPVGILGPVVSKDSGKVGLEAFLTGNAAPTKDELTFEAGGVSITLTDNIDVLKIPKYHQKAMKAKVAKRHRVAMEAAGLDFTYHDRDVYKDRTYGHKNVEEVKPVEDSARLTVGHPLEQIFPSESLIPVTVPGNVRHHMGYLCVLDDLGYPISKHSLMNNSAAVSWIFSNPQSTSMDDAAKGLGFGDRPDNEKWTAAKLVESYTDLVEAKLIASLKNGGFGDSVNLIKPQEVYRIMMARAMAKKHTQILYIPAEQMCYFALEYDDFGMGRSLIDKTKLIGTIRTAMMLASMQASVLNATRETEYTISLDPNDRNAEKTIRNIEQEIMEAFANDIPYSGTPDDMAAYFSRAGIRFNIEGNDYYPSTKVSKNDNNPDYKGPDKESEEMYQRLHLRGLLADPDTIMNPENIEFAAQVTSKSILNAKRIVMVQERISPQITHYVKTYTISDGILLRKLAELARNYYSQEAAAAKNVAEKKAAEAEGALDPDNLDMEAVSSKDEATSDAYPFGKEGEVVGSGENADALEDYGNSPDRLAAPLREKINRAVSNFIETISVTLPPPDNSMLNSQKQAFDDRVEALDKFLEHLIPEDAVQGTKYEGDLERVRGIVKSYLLRTWLRNNDIDRDMQELFDADGIEEILANIVENNLSHSEWVIRLLKKQDSRKTTLATNLDAAGESDSGGGDGGYGGDESGYDGGGNDGYGGDGDSSGGMDATGSDDAGGGDDGLGDFDMDGLGGEELGGGDEKAEPAADETAGADAEPADADADGAAEGDDTANAEADDAHQEVTAMTPDSEDDEVVDIDKHGTLADVEVAQDENTDADKSKSATADKPEEKSDTETPEDNKDKEKDKVVPEKKEPETKKEEPNKGAE